MHIQEQDLFHGAALTQLVEFADSITLTKFKDSFGHYLINNEINMVIKYRSNTRSPWRFIFSDNEIENLQQLFNNNSQLYLVLICGNKTICVLNKEELDVLIDISSDEKWICVEARYGSSLWVKGSKDKLNYSIRHNDFPKKIFEAGCHQIGISR